MRTCTVRTSGTLISAGADLDGADLTVRNHRLTLTNHATRWGQETSMRIKFHDRESWLRERRRGIGGSDIGAILGLNKYRSPLDVYLDKIGDADRAGDQRRDVLGDEC